MIEQKFRNKPAILVATGPSLTEEVVEVLRQYKNDYVIFGCNDSYRIIDFLDIHYACDKRWWDYHGATLREKYPDLESYSQHKESCSKYNLTWIQGKHERGLSTDSGFIHYGANSGYQMLNLALLLGCNKFILVGYNMSPVGAKRHFFGDHPSSMNSTSPYNLFIDNYRTIQKELHPYIVNCTPNSRLTMFRQNDLEKELKCE